jgi:putative tryptophan/tyrosine transport system substrate-binding protein
VCPGALVNANFVRINTFALGARLPAFHASRDFLGSGGFMSYGANFADQFRHAGDFVDKILKGTKPADIPVQQPTKFELVVNLTAAKALRVTVPETFLARADEVIE